MKKKSGFIFVETIIVIAVLTTALLLLYSTFTGILNQEKRRAAYDDIAYIYRTYYLMEFYSDVAQRNLSLGIDEENYMVSIPLVASNATDLIPEEEKSFYEQLMASTFSATNVYFANGDLSKYEACSEGGTSEVSCDILNDLAGNGWKGYFKTLGDTTENAYIIAVYGVNENGKGGNQCFRIGNDEVTADETECKFYYASIPIEPFPEFETPELHCGTTDLITGDGPELNNGLIPVIYENNKWVKVDITKKWYDYCEQWWANAVTVKEIVRTTYQNAPAGTEIPMSAINTMWVWIPRYEYDYKILEDTQYAGGSQTEPGPITINFINQDVVTSSSSNFIVHPAFTFGDQQLSGMWVAKFELSTGNTSCTPITLSTEIECDLSTIKPTVLPDVTPWRGARVGTFFTSIKENMNGSHGQTTYGITNSDTHMMKNMEWGAVAYLSQSKYGKYGNSSYTGVDKEVAINNCSTYITGIGGDSVSANSSTTTCTTNTYETEKGQAASTAGNIYGIYDMSGGAWEYVMGVMKESTNSEVAVGFNWRYNSGFSGKLYDGTIHTGIYGYLKNIDAKYYDVYDYGTTEKDAAAYARGHLGDATKEVVGWHQDYLHFLNNDVIWSVRGGYYYEGIDSGVFYFRSSNGNAIDNISARAVLVSST